MPCKKIIITALCLCLIAVPLWAQPNERTLTDYVGGSAGELVADAGAPQLLRLEDPPFLTFVYLDKTLFGRSYDVAYMVLGNHVVSLRYNVNSGFEPKPSHFNPGRGFTDYLNKSAKEIIALEGPPMVHMYFPGQSLEQLSYEKINIAGKLYGIVYELEDDVVITIAYQYAGAMPADKTKAFVRGLDADIMKDVGESEWVLGDSDTQPVLDNAWRYLRMISGSSYNVTFVAMADLGQNLLKLDIGFQSRQAPGARAKRYSEEHELGMLEFSQYVSHSENILKLLETGAEN